MNKRNRLADLQILSEYFSGERTEEELSDRVQDRLRRVRTAHAGLLGFKSHFIIIGTLMKEYNLSQVQAYRDINLAYNIFGDFRKANKEVKRHISEEMALKTFRLAEAQGDLKVMALANKNYTEASGIKIEDPDLPDWEKLQPSAYAIIVDDRIEGMLQQLLEGPSGSINLSNIMNKTAQNAEYSEIEEQSDHKGDSAAS